LTYLAAAEVAAARADETDEMDDACDDSDAADDACATEASDRLVNWAPWRLDSEADLALTDDCLALTDDALDASEASLAASLAALRATLLLLAASDLLFLESDLLLAAFALLLLASARDRDDSRADSFLSCETDRFTRGQARRSSAWWSGPAGSCESADATAAAERSEATALMKSIVKGGGWRG